ncbi:hypothetical protein K474DRAFT_1708111 [Panus rudis PR-1116 ss-1]|nr:hypothetical protein K474DRAFT_1708111 [Panus rudis PR-1116 ss-1]
MPKHSSAYPSVPASAPTSPAVTRKAPATPQRSLPRPTVRHFQSPLTPGTGLSTPFTPISMRSVSSSNGSSLATPASAAGHNRRLSLTLSPEASFQAAKSSKRSLADIADNWRTRASENGIKVTTSSENSQYVDDDADFDTSSFFGNDKALLPAPFLSTQRRARAFSQVQPQLHHSPLAQITNPAQLSTPARMPLSQIHPLSPAFLNTPPPKAAVVNKLKLRGAVTDPAQTRRRPAFGQLQNTTELCDIDEDEYDPYPQVFPTVGSQTLPLAFQDSFDLSNISESVPYYDNLSAEFEEIKPLASPEVPLACSVCGLANGALALLEPCHHPLCSACLTSALNIVGEKDMQCAVCNAKVDDFKLQNFKGIPTVDPEVKYNRSTPVSIDAYNQPFDFYDEGFDDFIDRAQGASTPVAGVRSAGRKPSKGNERVVLRIDNVPWDITPPAIANWLKHPVERVHVLLDRKGKTLSHAFVEMATPEAAQAALRSSQNSVLGRGKRARGVTVTRSNQEELMRALFPSWQGNFDGARPSLAGLSNEHVIATLQQGLISDGELKSLLHLIRSPDSHFLKVPSLPFHSLMSILSKFPCDDDSRVFWSGTSRDSLYDVTYAAVQVLLTRIEDNPFSEWATILAQLVRCAMECQAFTSEQMSKLSDMLEAAMPQQSSRSPSTRTTTHTPDSVQLMPMETHSPNKNGSPPKKNGNSRVTRRAKSPFGDIAEEFGVEAHVVEALVQRLSELS